MSGPSSWGWGAVYRVVLGLCLRATKITATAILPYQGTQKEKAGEEIQGLCCFIQNYVRVSLGCKACSCFCFSACFTHLGWEEWRLVWEMGVPICCSCHKDWREGLGNTFLLKCSFKKNQQERPWKETIFSCIPFLLDALWDPSQGLPVSTSSW